jgi:predicted transcriptional regulator
MARPKSEQPTPAELEVLKILWSRGSSTVRDVMDDLNTRPPRRAYTSVMSLMKVMVDKNLLRTRKTEGRAFVYESRLEREKTLETLLGDLLSRAFEGSSSSLVSHLLAQSSPSMQELDEIRRTIEQYVSEDEDK